ncbi:MAG: HD domain-containing protein [Anaerolineae bacterium]
MAGAAAHRVRQFFAAVTAGQLSGADRSLVETYLTPAQRALFERMSANDRQHAIAVVRTLLARGWHGPDLIQAALLHDVGKADGGLHLGYRVAIVLLRAFWPTGLQWLAATDSGWRRPFHIHQHHPEIGARLAAEAGASPRVVELILRHQSPADGHESIRGLAALKAADESQ